jgi:hypothetical protein
MERHSEKLLRPRSLIRDLKPHYEKLSRLPRSLICELRDVSDEFKMLKSPEEDARDVIADDPDEQLLQAIRRGAAVGEVESYLDLTFPKISAAVDEQRNERDKKRALARARVYDKALGEAKDDTTIQFLVKKLQKDDCLQRGGHCEMVDCSAVRWNLVNVVLALIRSRGAAEVGTFLRKEELLAIAVEYGHVKLVRHLTEMQDVNVNIAFGRMFTVFCSLGDWKPNNARITDQSHVIFLKPIGSAARRNVGVVMSLLACDRIDVNKGKPLHWAVAMGHLDVVKKLLQSEKQVDVNAVKFMPLEHEGPRATYGDIFSPLHLASLFGHTSVVKALCEDSKGRLRANTENW